MRRELESKVSSQVYLAEDISSILGISRSKAYYFLGEAYKNQKPFRVLKVGKLLRVPKDSFDAWINGKAIGGT